MLSASSGKGINVVSQGRIIDTVAVITCVFVSGQLYNYSMLKIFHDP